MNHILPNIDLAPDRPIADDGPCMLLSKRRPAYRPRLAKTASALIVDDNDGMRQWLRQIISRRFPAVALVEAADGESALEKVASQGPDVVFMDIRLPGKSGLEVTRIIKSIHCRAKVCVVTSFDLPEYRDAAFGSGADHFFVKDALIEEDIVAVMGAMLAAEPAG